MSAALTLSTEKVKVLNKVSQVGKTIAGPSWTIKETVEVILVVDTRFKRKVSLVRYTSYPTEENRADNPAQEVSSEVKKLTMLVEDCSVKFKTQLHEK